jgi:hypothetical protein
MSPINISAPFSTVQPNETNKAKELVDGMLQSGEFFWEKLISEWTKDCQLYEKIKGIILNEYPVKKAVLRQIKTHLSFMLTPAEAQGIVASHPDRKHMRLVQIAEHILALNYTFSNQDQADTYFRERKACYVAAHNLRKELSFLQKRVASGAPRDIRYEGKWTQVYHDSFELERKLEQFKKDGNLEKIPYWRHLNLLNNVARHSLLKVHEANSLNAKNAYRAFIQKYMGGNLKPDYQRVLLGENGAIPILSYYGFEFREDHGNSCCPKELFPLVNSYSPGSHFGYSLEFPTIADFENEIRGDLSSPHLPPPIYAEEKRLIPLTDKEQEMRALFEGDFGRWNELSETACEFAVREFIAWNSWDRIGIQSTEVVFFQMVPGTAQIEGRLLIKDHLIPFTFHLTTMTVQVEGLPRDSRISLFHLKQIKESGKRLQDVLSCKRGVLG